MKCKLNVLLGALVALVATSPTAAFAAKANVKILHEGSELVAYRGDGTQVNFGPSFDAFLDFEIPPGGGSATGSFQVLTELTLNGGGIMPLAGSGVVLHHDNPLGYLDAEVLSMSLATPPGAQPLRIRESPTLASLGRTTLTTVGGQVSVDSFFDINIELSLDGGTSWSALTPQLVLTSVPEPASLYTLLIGIALCAAGVWRNTRLPLERLKTVRVEPHLVQTPKDRSC